VTLAWTDFDAELVEWNFAAGPARVMRLLETSEK
jgi:hypothetical protein